MYELKVYRGVVRHGNEEWCKILKRIWLVFSKLAWVIWWILTREVLLKSLKHLHFNWRLSTKVHNVWAKNVQRSYLSWHWRVMKIFEEKLPRGLENDRRHLKNFHRRLKSLKIRAFTCSFHSKQKMYELKI